MKAALFACVFTFCILGHADIEPVQKNIIIISIDTLRADHLGCYGYPINTTPAIDALAKDGVLFSSCYTPTPLTTPSFSTMLTGLPPYKHGAKRNGLSVYKNVKTLPYYLNRYGYQSAAIVSNWPLRKKLVGLNIYFDSYYEIFNQKRYMGIMNAEGEAAEVTKRAIRWLKKRDNKAFFLWVQYTDPHAVYIQHKKFSYDYSDINPSVYPAGTRMEKIKRYDSEIGYTDYYIGKLIATLKEKNFYHDSLIFINSDHGESFGEHNYFKHGRKLFNSTLHVPLIVKLPANRIAGTVREENVSLLDISRTILGELNMAAAGKFGGVDLFNERDKLLDRNLLFETYGGTVIFKRRNRKYQLKVQPIKFGILSAGNKLIYDVKSKTYKFFNLDIDPFEQENRYISHPSVLDQLQATLSGEINRIANFIKACRGIHVQSNLISERDLKFLKTLGYIDD